MHQNNNKTGFTTTPYTYNHQPIPMAPPPLYTATAQPPTTYPTFQPQVQMAVAPQYYQTAPYPPQNYNFPPHPAAAAILHHPGPPPTYGGPQYPTGYCPAPAYQPPMAAHQQMYNVGTVPQRAIFDDGARFNGKGAGTMTVPPPPPGYAPTPAQIAAMQGQPVMIEKNKANFFTGGKGGGYTFW